MRALDDADMNVQFHAIEALGPAARDAGRRALAGIAERRVLSCLSGIQALAQLGDPGIALVWCPSSATNY